MRGKILFLAAFALLIGSVGAVPVSRDTAAFAARAWAAKGHRLGVRLGTEVEKVAMLMASNNATFFAVKMKGGGTIFTAGDTELEPIVCFTGSKGDFSEIDPKSPLWALLNRDLAVRTEILRRERAAESSVVKSPSSPNGRLATAASAPAVTTAPSARLANRAAAKSAWARLLAAGPKVVVSTSTTGGMSLRADAPADSPPNRVELPDAVMVAPLLETKWSQSTHNDHAEWPDGDGLRCYNYALEPCYIEYADGPSEGLLEEVYPPCGCTATATAQVMRYFKYPYASYETNTSYRCALENWSAYYDEEQGGYVAEAHKVYTNMTIRGGIYDWEKMTAVPAKYVAETNCAAIGHLTRDVGVAIMSEYTPGGTGALIEDIVPALTEAFRYGNACVYVNDAVVNEAFGGDGYVHAEAGLHDAALRQKVIYANLDARRPVILGIHGYPIGMVGDNGSWSGHAVVADGYGWNVEEGEGYTNRTDYVHINMGWSGQDDYWYNLPEIIAAETGATAGDSGFDFTVLRGAVYNVFTNETGEIVSGRVLKEDGTPAEGAQVSCGVLQTRTDANGIYALIVPANTKNLVVNAEVDGGNAIGTVTVTTGTSNAKGAGNVWGADIVLGRSPLADSVRNLRTGTAYAYLDYACAAAEAGDSLQIEKTTALKGSAWGFDRNLTIFAADAEPTNTPVRLAAGTLLSVGAGVRLALTNVAFCGVVTTNVVKKLIGRSKYAFETNIVVAALEPMTVAAGGSLAVAGRVTLPEIETAAEEGFVLAGALERPVTLLSPSLVRGAQIGKAECSEEDVVASTKLVVNPKDDFLGVTSSPHPTLVWDLQTIPDDEVAATLEQESGAEVYRYATLDRLLQDVKPNATIVLRKNGTLTRPHVVTNGYLRLLGDAGGARAVLEDLGSSAGFKVGDGGEMTVSNVVFRNYTGEGLFQVDGEGAKLSLVSGTTIYNAEGTATWSGALAIHKGEATVGVGATIEGCYAHGYGTNVGTGGGAWLKGAGCTMNLSGGKVLNSRAQSYGGGVYVGRDAKLVLSGDAKVYGNTSGGAYGVGTNRTDNVYVANFRSKDSHGAISLRGELTAGYGSVGVGYEQNSTASKYGNGVSNLFAVVDCSVEAATNSLSAFFNDTSAKLEAARSPDGGTLLWQPIYDGPRLQPTENPDYPDVARIVRSAELTNYFYRIEDAVAAVDETNLVIEVLTDVVFTAKMTVPKSTAICRAAESLPETAVSRAALCGITVPAGVTLTVSNLTVRGRVGELGGLNPFALFSVNGGGIVLGEGATLCDVEGDADRSAGAVEVYGGGSVTLDPGAAIFNCTNRYVNVGNATGVGAGILVDAGTAYLNGGTVSGCCAYRAAGVYVGNGGSVYVKGPLAIAGNHTLDGRASDFVTADLNTPRYLSGELVGDVTIGIEEGIRADTNVFGQVDLAYEGELMDLAGSAAKFFRDDNPEVHGLLATNGADAALLVWRTAVFEDEEGVWWHRDARGNLYRVLGGVDAMSPASAPKRSPAKLSSIVTNEPGPISFKQITRISEEEWKFAIEGVVKDCDYALSWAPDLTSSFTTGGWFRASSSGILETNVIFKAEEAKPMYWRAHGRTTYIEETQQ